MTKEQTYMVIGWWLSGNNFSSVPDGGTYLEADRRLRDLMENPAVAKAQIICVTKTTKVLRDWVRR